MERYKEIERSIIKRYRKEIWSRFIKAVKEYNLIKENDNIMVCISGGKDSFLLAKCIEELHRHSKVKFNAKYVVMNPGYTEEVINKIKENASLLNMDIEIFDSDIFEVADKLSYENPCYMCAKMRRGALYNHALTIGCNKIALGHHFDDVIETSLLSIFYGSEVKTMMPKLKSEHFANLELIRPLYLVKEDDIKSWCRYNNLSFINCACRFTQKVEDDISVSKRREIKELIKNLKKVNPHIDNNIFKALDNVNISCVLGIKKDGQYHSFLDEYEK